MELKVLSNGLTYALRQLQFCIAGQVKVLAKVEKNDQITVNECGTFRQNC